MRELQPIVRIGVESELSKYPLHNLSQRDIINIEIRETNERGQLVKWEVSYNNRFGRAGPLAYKVDAMVLNRRIDEARRLPVYTADLDAFGNTNPIPEVLPIGSLSEIAEMLQLGNDTPAVKRALRQNVGIIINAKIKHKRADGTEKSIEAVFSRYNVVFTGEDLPGGAKADGVYLVLNKLYREILNLAPIQPQNWTHTEMPAASHRLYVLLSSRMYATLESNGREAKMLYSYLCERAPLTRHRDYQKFKSQIYKIQKPLKEVGYIDKVRWEQREDSGGLDWMMCFTPGPLAKAEYNEFNPTKKQIPIEPGELTPVRKGRLPRSLNSAPAPGSEPRSAILAELARRGVGEADAIPLLNNLLPGQFVLDLLEYGDYLIARKQGKIENPPGFYISLLRRNVPLPPGFISSRKAREIQAANRAKQQARREQQQTAERTEQEHRNRLDARIDALPEERRWNLFEQAKAQLLASHPGMAVFFKANPMSAIDDGAVRDRMRQILTQAGGTVSDQA